MSVASATALHDVRTVVGQADRRPAASKTEFRRVHTDCGALLVSHKQASWQPNSSAVYWITATLHHCCDLCSSDGAVYVCSVCSLHARA